MKKSVRIIILVLAALASVVMYFTLPNFTWVVGFMIWSACLLAEEKISLKSILILLLIPICLPLFFVIFIVASSFIMVFIAAPLGIQITSDTTVFAVSIIVIDVLFAFGLLDLLLILRHRKKARLTAPAFVIFTAVAFLIRLAIMLQFYFSLLVIPDVSADTTAALEAVLSPPQAMIQLLVLCLTVYLPPLGVILAPPTEPDLDIEIF